MPRRQRVKAHYRIFYNPMTGERKRVRVKSYLRKKPKRKKKRRKKR